MAAVGMPVLICDLDGTILQCNSFPLWIRYLMVGPLPEFGLRARVTLSLRVQKLLLHRRLGRIDHARLLREAQREWHAASQGAAPSATDRVAALLRQRVRPAFEPVLQQIAAGEFDAVLATAAAAEYAGPLGRQLGFRHVLTTPPHGALNHGEGKLLRVREFLVGRHWEERSRVLLTDHLDDLPLVQQCHAVGWFGSAAMLSHASAAAKGVHFADCRWLDATGLLRAIVALSEQARSVAASARAFADSTLA